MDWLAGSRMHPVDVIATRAAAYLPVFLLGFAAPALYAYLVFVSFHAVFIHANVRWRFPYLRWVLSTPEYHHWHHTSDEEGIDKNFASFLRHGEVPAAGGLRRAAAVSVQAQGQGDAVRLGARDIAKSRQNSEYPQSVRRIAETR